MKSLDRLIEILSEERREKIPPLSESEKPQYFRALCNLRMPLPATEEFIKLQDEYLSEQTQKRGIVNVANLDYRGGIALWQGDITRLNSDAIVNACNSKLLGCFQPLHNCIDNCIHSFAGVQVRLDCQKIMQGGDEPNGKVKVTSAYNLPSKYIFHTVGPIVSGKVTAQNKSDLQSCYISCLEKAKEMNLKSIAFCCLSTGVFGYPKDEACALAVRTVKAWLAKDGYNIKIIFNVFTDEDKKFYERELA
ncbi:MAG: protein-ADP-ribose hydrolase [Treponema sp.]|nr:protein-ADP-ribose hydrolase [Treponema sp.]